MRVLFSILCGACGIIGVYAAQWLAIRRRAAKLYPGQLVGMDPKSVLRMRPVEAVTAGAILFVVAFVIAR